MPSLTETLFTSPALLVFGAIALLVAASFALGALSRMPPRTRVRRIGVVLALVALLAAHGLGWLALQDFQRQIADARLHAADDAMARDALAYLAHRCDTERHLTISSEASRVPANEGVLLDIEHVRRPALDEVPPVDWFDPLDARQVLATSAFVFVEQDRRMTSRGAISVTAHRLWWESTGRALLPPANTEEFMARLVQVDLSQSIEGPVSASSARYLLSVQDTSTLEDRSHGVARIELRLFDRRQGAPMAEYVGFVAHLLPAYRLRDGRASREIRPCSGPEQAFTTAEAGFDVIGFFLVRGVRVAKERPRLMT